MILEKVCLGKIHRATVTEANLDYVGSITIDRNILDIIGIRPFEYVNITNLSNGIYWRTYVMPGSRGEGGICLNGPPARHFQPKDEIIILWEVDAAPSDLNHLRPTIVFVDPNNQPVRVEIHEIPEVGSNAPTLQENIIGNDMITQRFSAFAAK